MATRRALDWPVCVPCRRWLETHHLRTVRPGTLPRAEVYVRVKGTTGLYRHSCRRCVAQTGDTIIATLPDDDAAL